MEGDLRSSLGNVLQSRARPDAIAPRQSRWGRNEASYGGHPGLSRLLPNRGTSSAAVRHPAAKSPRQRRPGMPRENPLVFYLRRAWEILASLASLAAYHLRLERLRKQINRDPAADAYTDAALAEQKSSLPQTAVSAEAA